MSDKPVEVPTGFTPGPWRVGQTSDEPGMPEIAIIDERGRCPAVTIPLGNQTEANARLIAAAPTLAAEVTALRTSVAEKDAEIARLTEALGLCACECEGRCTVFEWMPADSRACAHACARIALGWRAPGPPTEEEVERAVDVLATEDGREWEDQVIRKFYGRRYADLARAALTAALRVEKGKSDDNA